LDIQNNPQSQQELAKQILKSSGAGAQSTPLNQKKGSVRKEGTSDFLSVLENVSATQAPSPIVSNNDELLQTLFSDLDEKGGSLEKNPTVASFTAYKNSVQKMLRFLYPQTHTLQKSISPPRIQGGRMVDRKEYHVIEEVNKELISLYGMLQEKEAGRLKIAATVVTIKGLLVDFKR
jgi:uncharacterized protein YaaR (DUF327 family)